MLSFIPYLALVLILCLATNLASWGPYGIIRAQWPNLTDFRNLRTFNNDGELSVGRIALMLQWFAFSGITLYAYFDADPYRHLAHPDLSVARDIALCVAVPLVIFFVQWLLYHWWGYIFGQADGIHILDRIYLSAHLLASPFVLVFFLLQSVGLISPLVNLFLLALISITVQIFCFLSGIRIFWRGFGTLFIFFLYLCAFNIVPLLIIWTKTNS